MAAAVNSEACGDETVGFLFDKHLATEEDCSRFDVGAGDDFEGFVGVEMLAEFLGYAGLYVEGGQQERRLANGHFGSLRCYGLRLQGSRAIVKGCD